MFHIGVDARKGENEEVKKVQVSDWRNEVDDQRDHQHDVDAKHVICFNAASASGDVCLDPNVEEVKDVESARDNKGDGWMGHDLNEGREKEERDHGAERHDFRSCDLDDGREHGDKDQNIMVLLQSYCDENRIGLCQKGPVVLREMIDLVGQFSAAYGIDHTGGGGVSRYALSYVLARAYCACGSSTRLLTSSQDRLACRLLKRISPGLSP